MNLFVLLFALCGTASAAAPSALDELLGLADGGPPAVAAPRAVAAAQRVPAELETVIDGIRVRGSSDFVARTRAALKLLKKSSEFSEIAAVLHDIVQAPCSGIDPTADPATYHVGEPTWKSGPLWYAGTIAHDSYHPRLYRQAKLKAGGLPPPRREWVGAYAETVCLQYQLEVLKELKAPKKYLDYLAGLAKGPTYQITGPRRYNAAPAAQAPAAVRPEMSPAPARAPAFSSSALAMCGDRDW